MFEFKSGLSLMLRIETLNEISISGLAAMSKKGWRLSPLIGDIQTWISQGKCDLQEKYRIVEDTFGLS